MLLPSSPFPRSYVVRAIFQGLMGPATWLVMLGACGSRHSARPAASPGEPAASRVLPLARVLVLETSGPPPSDTAVSFTAGTPRIITLRHGPPENIVFARLTFSAAAFADSGQTVTVEVRPRPGLYGLDISSSASFRAGALVEFDYARYFSAPARARQVYGSDAAYERALAVGRVLPDNQVELLPSTVSGLDHVGGAMPGPGSYLVAAPQ
jgi:hypothetical protein